MRIALSTYPMAFHAPGGAERQIVDLRDALGARGVRAHLFDQWNPRLDEVDIVHFFSVVGGSWHFCNFVRRLGIPLVISPNLWIEPGRVGDYPMGEIAHQLSLADRIIVNSEAEKTNLAGLFNLDPVRLHVVKSWISPEFTAPADPGIVRTVLDIDTPFVLSVGNIAPARNQLAVVEALKNLDDLSLVLIGDVEDEAYLAECQEKGGAQLRYIGSVPHSARLLRSAMVACRAFVSCGNTEASTLSALEAASQGAPIVISRDGSMQEYLGDFARYVQSDSAASILEALRTVPAWRKDAAQQRAFIARNYSSAEAARSIEQIYRSML